MDYQTALVKALEYGRQRGDEYDISAETKGYYFFGMQDIPVDDMEHGVFISKKNGRILKEPLKDPKFIGKPKVISRSEISELTNMKSK